MDWASTSGRNNRPRSMEASGRFHATLPTRNVPQYKVTAALGSGPRCGPSWVRPYRPSFRSALAVGAARAECRAGSASRLHTRVRQRAPL